MQNPTVTDALKISDADAALIAQAASEPVVIAAVEQQPQQIVELADISTLLGDAFERSAGTDHEAEIDAWAKDFAGDDSDVGPDQVKWDAALAEKPADAGADSKVDGEASPLSHDEMMDQLSAAFGEGFDPAVDEQPLDEDVLDVATEGLEAGATSPSPGEPLSPGQAHAFDEATVNALIDAAKERLANDTQDAMVKVNGAGEQSTQQRTEVGILQGMNLLGGAGLASLATVIKAGGKKINSTMNGHRYATLSGEVGTLTNSMDTALNTFVTNGYLEGLQGLKGDNRADFAREFLAIPANKQALEETLEAMGKLSTKARAAVEAGHAADISGEQIDSDVIRKIEDVREKHKDLMDALTDHKGNKLSDRMSELLDHIMELIDKIFDRVKQTLGGGPRPSM